MKKLQINQRRFKYGTLATVITIIFIAVVVLVNILASMILERFPAKVDLTENKLFSLSDESIDYLKTIDKDIEITVLSEESSLSSAGTDAKQVVEIINKYAQYSDKIKVNYINPDKNPEIITQFNALYKGDVSSEFVVIKCGERIKALATDDLITSSSQEAADGSTSTLTTSITEQSMTSAIMAVTDANPMKVTVLTTDSLTDVTPLTDMLKTNGYEIEEVDAATGTIDQESNLVILNSPSNDLTDEQITKLDTYLSNDGKLGRNIMYIASYGQKATPKLDVFLAEWGIEVGTGYTMDSNSNNIAQIQSGVYAIYTSIDNENYTKEMQNTSLDVLVLASRPINLLYETKDSRLTESLLKTEDTAYIVPDDATEDTDVSQLPQGAVNVMAVGSKYVYDSDNKKNTSNILTLGSGYIVNSSFMESANLNNGDYVLSAINTMTGKTAGISIVAKDLTQTTLDITEAQMIIVRNIVLLFIPLIIIVIGIVIWARRRNR